MHQITQNFLNVIKKEEDAGRVYYEYELIYKYRQFYAKWHHRKLEFEFKRKPLRATIYEELRKTVKTQKDAEMQAECHPTYQQHINDMCEAIQISLEAYALLSGLESKIAYLKSQEIANHTARKYANNDGYGS